MKYLSVTIQCKILDHGIFPPYKGSMLRGVLGSSLHNAVCMTKKTDCSQCMIHKTCIFTKLFTASPTESSEELPAKQKIGQRPLIAPPYCIEPPLDEKCIYESGEIFTFGLKLFSYADEYLPYFIHALSMAGKRGMGKRTELGEGKFIIENVYCNNVAIYDHGEEILSSYEGEELALPAFQDMQTHQKQALSVTFLSPVRFKQENRLSSELSFSQLINLIVRRIKSLWALEEKEVWIDNYSHGMQDSKDIVLVKNDLYWKDWTRYSGKQNTKMQLGGLMGRVQYEGKFDDFIELLNFATKVHIGKQTSFGLGAFDYKLKELV